MTRQMSFSHLNSQFLLPLLLILLLGLKNSISKPQDNLQTYIIHMDPSHKPPSFSTHEAWHKATLNSLPSSSPQMSLLYSYNHVMHGFSARLTSSQLSEIHKSPAHLATHHESFGKLFTTHTTHFLGLQHRSGLWPAASCGEDVIIGMIDTGIWPESESFSDKGMSPVPGRWKGNCENGTAFGSSACNRKLIGARSFSKGLAAAGINISKELDYDSARDPDGHGTHTSSIAAGNHVLGANYFGYARGTARGVAPAARFAMYKVLWETDTEKTAASDVLAGMDQAISDGVEIMSLSLGFDLSPYFNDVIAIASLSAIEKGIFVVCAAGNDGDRNSTHNGAPWIMTVGAGTVDRSFTATMTLGNGFTIEGTSYFPESIYITNANLYYGGENAKKALCKNGTLVPHEVAGKVVLCDNSTKIDIEGQIKEINRAGAYAGIFFTDILILNPDDYYIPSLILPTASGNSIRDYVKGASNATVKTMRFMSTKLGTTPAPQVAHFSSKGPDPITPNVLKPDIIAPGVDVLAAVAPNRPRVKSGIYNLVTDYALLSGTSMAAPHVAGVAALLKSVHRDWSPAAIRSAIMTTAYVLDNTNNVMKDQGSGHAATPLDFGAGHINPNKAMDPGLIYDMNFQDYIDFLCNLRYNKKQMSAVLRQNQWNCNRNGSDHHLNYPSFVSAESSPMVKNFSRVVTNVGDAAVYKAVVEVPDGMRVRTEPSRLRFSRKNQKKSFMVSVEIDKEAPRVIFGYLKWIDQHNHVVSSPIVAISI